jgi:hypothetical protein
MPHFSRCLPMPFVDGWKAEAGTDAVNWTKENQNQNQK